MEIPADQKRIDKADQKVKILVLCQDIRSCSQLNDYLTMGPQKCMFLSAIRNGINVSKFSDEYKEFKTAKSQNVKTSKSAESTSNFTQDIENLAAVIDEVDEDEQKDNFVLTMSQAVLDNISQCNSSANNESHFEPFTQVKLLHRLISLIENHANIFF